jgi:hypothetical protein
MTKIHAVTSSGCHFVLLFTLFLFVMFLVVFASGLSDVAPAN